MLPLRAERTKVRFPRTAADLFHEFGNTDGGDPTSPNTSTTETTATTPTTITLEGKTQNSYRLKKKKKLTKCILSFFFLIFCGKNCVPRMIDTGTFECDNTFRNNIDVFL